MARLLARAAQVRFADSGTNAGERGQTNAENKLFVGGVPAGCGDKELRSLFSNYGDVQDVYILASKALSSPPAPSRTQRGLRRPLSTLLSLAQQEGQRGCAFVRFASPQSCAVAIEALHGKYAMKAGELPLVVRYADPPKSQRGGGLSTTASRFPWPGAPPMWSAGPPPPGWPLPWGLGGMGMTPYAPWMGIPGVAQPASGAPNYHPPPPAAAAAAAAAAQHLQEQQQAQQPFQACAPQQHPQSSQSQQGNAGPQVEITTAAPPLSSSSPASSSWSEHHTPEGLKYYYNNSTGTSSWERPPELRPAAAAAQAAPQQTPQSQASASATPAALAPAMAALSMSSAPYSSAPLATDTPPHMPPHTIMPDAPTLSDALSGLSTQLSALRQTPAASSHWM